MFIELKQTQTGHRRRHVHACIRHDPPTHADSMRFVRSSPPKLRRTLQTVTSLQLGLRGSAASWLSHCVDPSRRPPSPSATPSAAPTTWCQTRSVIAFKFCTILKPRLRLALLNLQVSSAGYRLGSLDVSCMERANGIVLEVSNWMSAARLHGILRAWAGH